MAKILNTNGVNFKLLIAGEGELKASLQKDIDSNNLTEKVKLLGHVENIKAFMNSLDVFAFPSLFEGSANTLIEAMYYEVPSVAFEVSSNSEIIQNNQTGFLVQGFDVPLFTDKILELAKNKSLNDEFRLNSRRIVSEKFDYNQNIEALVTLTKKNV